MPAGSVFGRASALLALLIAASANGPATAQAPAPPVTVSLPVSKEVADWREYTGQFQAVEYVEIRARVSGYLTEIHFSDGQRVSKGDLLFVIDPRPYEITLATARAQLGQAQAKLDLATRQLGRSTTLRERDFATQSTVDVQNADLRSAAAALDSAKAQIRSAELDLEFTRVTAPVSGRVGDHQVSIGNLIAGNAAAGSPTLLTTIVSLDPIHILFDVNEADYIAYRRTILAGELQSPRDVATPVTARLTDEKGWPHAGTIDFVDNRIDRSAGTLRARAAIANPDLLIIPGQFGRVRVPASAPHPALLVPDSAILTDQARKILLTVAEDGTVVPKIVEPGQLSEGLRIINTGLAPADRVIINGLVRARPGAKVAPHDGPIVPEPQD